MTKTRIPSWQDEVAARPLSKRAQAALRLLKGKTPMTLQEIADRVGLSKARVHQIRKRYIQGKGR